VTMLRWLSRFGSYPASRKVLFLEAFWLCVVVKLMIVCLPFRLTQRLLGFKACQANKPYVENTDSQPIVRAIFNTIDAISRHVFWTNTCLVRSIVVKLLLRHRKIEAILYLGLAKEGTGQLKAHAWVKVLTTGLIYDDGSGEYTTVALLV
jgi:hypothetical protein